MRRILPAVLAALFLLALSCAGATEAVLFSEEGCPHCAHVKALLHGMQAEGTDLVINEYSITSPEAQSLLPRLLTAYGADIGPVPLLFIGEVAVVGDAFHRIGRASLVISGRAADEELRRVVEQAVADGAPSPASRVSGSATEAILVLSPDCPECERLDAWVRELEQAYPDLAVRRLSAAVAEDESALERLARFYRVRPATPALFFGDTAVVAGHVYPGRDRSRLFALKEEVEAFVMARLERAIADKATSPLDRVRVREKLTLWAVIGSAILDSFNPCDFAVMLLLLGRLLVIGRRQKILVAGLVWSAGVFLVYFLMGYVFYTLLGITVGTRSLRVPYILTVSSIAILMGLWQMKDLLWYGKWFSIEVPDSWKPLLKRVTNSVVSLPGIFVAGLVDALFLAPCTSGPYLAILSLLSTTTTRTEGILLLLLYNVIFILPMIVIAVTVHFGLTTTARAERWRTAKLGKLHFVSGVVMVVLGVGMIVGVQLGYI